ncbi:hypothetical protein, partial [Roseibium sp.]|uniref:hypothetical protein n=1 Tax=Roseibium sp. TaxID=1936156 RepID=UPI003D100FCC
KTLADDASLPAFQEAVCALDEPDAGAASDRPAKFEMLVAAENESQWLSSSFWCRAGERTFSFRCEGLPSKEDFSWLILPERYGRERPENRAGETATGRNHPEDHRT